MNVRIFIVCGLAVALAAFGLDLDPYKTRQQKGSVYNNSNIVVNIDGVGMGAAINALVTNEAALRVQGDAKGSNYTASVASSEAALRAAGDVKGSNYTASVAASVAAYAYSPTNPPPACTDIVARAVAAYAYSPTNRPFALTNVLISADRDTNGWWTLYIITNDVRSVMQ